MIDNKKISIIIAAAGPSVRLKMKDARSKQFVLLKGKPLLFYSLEKFSQLENIYEIIVVTSDVENTRKLLDQGVEKWDTRKIKVVLGGKLRQDSVYNGFKQLSSSCDLVLIHDVARPLFDINDVRLCIEKAIQTGAAVLAVPVIDTIKKSKSDKDGLLVEHTINRENIYSVQTPQVISYDLLFNAYKKYETKGTLGASPDLFTDESTMIELCGNPVSLIMGSRENIKITYPEDLEIATAILESQCSRKMNKKSDELIAKS